jgi:hypothetical protein
MARKAYDEPNRSTTGYLRRFRISILWLSQKSSQAVMRRRPMSQRPFRPLQRRSELSKMSGLEASEILFAGKGAHRRHSRQYARAPEALDRKLELVARTERTIVDLISTRHSLRAEWYIASLIVLEILLTISISSGCSDAPLSCTARQNGVLVCIARP